MDLFLKSSVLSVALENLIGFVAIILSFFFNTSVNEISDEIAIKAMSAYKFADDHVSLKFSLVVHKTSSKNC